MEEGYYWVREIIDPNEWIIAQYAEGLWWFIGGDEPAESHLILEVGERIIHKSII